MDARTALSPKKVRSVNVQGPAREGLAACKKRRTVTPRKQLKSPTRASTSRTKSRRAPSESRQTSTTSPYKVFADDTVYATDLENQLCENTDLVLSPPPSHPLSPSPRKKSPPRLALGLLAEEQRVLRIATPHPLTQNAFLTPPRPRFPSQRSVREDVMKSASPRLGRSLASVTGFTLYVDQNEYLAKVDFQHEIRQDADKENLWKTRLTV